jgi:hypothetical protein
MAVGIVLADHACRTPAEYGRLLADSGMTAAEARLVLRAEAEAVIAAWRPAANFPSGRAASRSRPDNSMNWISAAVMAAVHTAATAATCNK